MEWSSESIRRLLINSIIPIAICIIIGLIRYGWIIFELRSHTFVFIAYGIIGSLFFFSLRDIGLRNALYLLLILAFASELLTKTHHSMLRFISSLFFTAALAVSIFLYHKYFYSKNSKSLLYPFVLPFLMVLLFHIVQLGFALIHPASLRISWSFWFQILHSLVPTLLTGFGLGFGFWITDHPAVARYLHSAKEITS